MTELPPARFRELLPIADGCETDLVFARSVLLGIQTGRVFTDDAVRPGAALIRHSCGVALLCGARPSPGILRLAADLLLGRKRLDEKRFRLHCGNGEWERELEELLGSALLKYEDLERESGPSAARERLSTVPPASVAAWTRVRFEFNDSFFRAAETSPITVPGDFSLRRIDGDLYGKITGAIVPSSFWDSADRFLDSGAGFCLVAPDGSPASTAFSAYADDREIDIGIETAPSFRGLGLAGNVCRRMVEYCLENGYTPVWGTRKDNEGSRALARKLGFVESGFHPAYFAAG